MGDFHVGQIIGIPVSLASGPFAHEFLVSFDTETGPVSGFASEDEIRREDNDANYLLAVVENVSGDQLTVRISGSFFTTAGIAYITRDPHLRSYQAA